MPRGARIIDHTPMDRLGEPEDHVGPALFVLSDSARFVHGARLPVDGGVSAYGGGVTTLACLDAGSCSTIPAG